MTTKLILFYDAHKTGNAFLSEVLETPEGRQTTGKVLISLGKHWTLLSAVGEARRLGHTVEGWTSVDSGLAWIFGVEQFCTPFDNVPVKV